MLKRHYLFNPTQINNYNNFLKTLDNQSEEENKQNHLIKNIKLNKKEEINEFLKTADKTYISKQLFSPNFNGQNQKDIIIPPLRIKKSNRSNFILNANDVNKISIHIEGEIHTIQDILQLIETYKDDSAIQYNIDIKALHNIKEPLEELNAMIGMKELKKNIVDQILYFIQYLHKNKNSSGEFLHTVIYGPPGTGKTEIAKIMCKIYSKIGILSKGTFKKVTRSDLIAGYLGQTSLKTKEVINESLGGVLFIDEAYSLGNPEKRDSFAKECIDTLCEALSDNKEKLMVIIAGYEDELKENFFSLNRGLDSRFVWRFETDKYSDEDMYNIFIKMVRDIGWEIEENSGITHLWFNKNKEYFMFFGRDIETLLTKTKIAHSKRVFTLSEKCKKKLILIDLDKGFEIFLKNGDSKKQREEKEFKKYLYNTLYS
jgi:SpoVK/Ycf46/Vps4 family AAA+-type ATPase